MSDKAIIARSIAGKADYTDSLLSEKQSRHIKKGGLGKSGAFLEIYHLASKQSAIFKAFLTSITDSFNISFRSETAFGRSDPYRLYEGNERTISVGFDVPAFDIVEAMNNLAKISLVTSMLYPTYEETGQGINALQLKSPPIIRIKFANLITNTANPRGGAKTAGLAVAISNFSVNPNVEQGFFISNDKSGKGEMLYPKLFELSLDMAVIHEHPVGYSHTSGFDLGSAKSQGMRSYPYAVPKVEVKDEDFLRGKLPKAPPPTQAVKKESSAGKASSEPFAAGMSTADGRSVVVEPVGMSLDTAESTADLFARMDKLPCEEVWSEGAERQKCFAIKATKTKTLKEDTHTFPRAGKKEKDPLDALKAVSKTTS